MLHSVDVLVGVLPDVSDQLHSKIPSVNTSGYRASRCVLFKDTRVTASLYLGLVGMAHLAACSTTSNQAGAGATTWWIQGPGFKRDFTIFISISICLEGFSPFL